MSYNFHQHLTIFVLNAGHAFSFRAAMLQLAGILFRRIQLAGSHNAIDALMQQTKLTASVRCEKTKETIFRKQCGDDAETGQRC